MRELTLGEVADNVEDDPTTLKSQFCNIYQRVSVSISTYHNSLQLLLRDARSASYMNAQFYAVLVNDPDQFLTKAESLHVETYEKLCQQFKGQFLRVKDTNIAKAISEVAKQYRITQIVIGESQQFRWKLLRGALTQQLVGSLKHVDLHIIATEKSQ
ncbi:hypothetical protein [Microcoleus sp. Pol12B4]|uniref:hypothetical protein n=1 Tax=Microcoleus sp. Pol12B4 TaxID=3055395 RepID=UPI002FD55AFB